VLFLPFLHTLFGWQFGFGGGGRSGSSISISIFVRAQSEGMVAYVDFAKFASGVGTDSAAGAVFVS
jgi:hypothetical protein